MSCARDLMVSKKIDSVAFLEVTMVKEVDSNQTTNNMPTTTTKRKKKVKVQQRCR